MAIDLLDLRIPVPCIQGRFGSRLASYTTQVSPKHLASVLGHDPRSKNWRYLPAELREIYEYLQRKTDKNRRVGVSGYIEERFGPDSIAVGAFPAISIAFQNQAEFIPYSQENKAVGDLKIDISPNNIRILVDGLARVSGALDLEDEGSDELINSFSFPLTIYVPAPGTSRLTWKDMGQIFHDFNFRVQQVSKQHAVALDTSDLYIALANKLGASKFIVENGGVAERSASLGKKSTELVVQTVLVRTVRGACEGVRFQEADLASVDVPNLSLQTFESVRASIEEFFTGIASRMGKERFGDHASLHLSASGWQALGVIHHDVTFRLKLDAAQRSKVLDAIAGINWSRSNPDWLRLGIGHAEIDKKTGQQVLDDQGKPKIVITGSGRSNRQSIIDYVRDKTGIALLLPDDTNANTEAAA